MNQSDSNRKLPVEVMTKFSVKKRRKKRKIKAASYHQNPITL